MMTGNKMKSSFWLVLAVVVMLAGSTFAGGGENGSPQETGSVDSLTNTVGHIQKIKFSRISVDEALHSYPFLKHEIIDDSNIRSESTYTPVQIDVAKIRNGLLLVSLAGSLYCGTHGCQLLVYETSKDGTYRKLNFNTVVGYEIYLLDCPTKLSLLVTGGGGMDVQYSEWRYSGNALERIGQHKMVSDFSDCTATNP